MIGRGVRLGTIFGIPIRIDYSWILIVFLLTASLALSFGHQHPYLRGPARLSLGLSASLLLFASVLAHEMSHALVALRHDVGIRGITLFIFGGAAEMMEEPPNAGAELKIALAGPVMSLVLAVVFATFYRAGLGVLPLPLVDLLWFVSRMNLILVAFNIVPGFPLDGGRVLRAALWGVWGRLSPATRVASGVGSFFGAMVAVLGLVWIFDNFIGGLWFILIGLFLRNAARASYQQLLVKKALDGIVARDLMTADVLSVSPQTSLAEVVSSYILPKGASEIPVVEEGRLVGMLYLEDIRSRDRASWERLTASEVMSRDALDASISPEEDASEVLARLGREDRLLPVVRDGILVGVVTREDLLRRLRLHLELRR